MAQKNESLNIQKTGLEPVAILKKKKASPFKRRSQTPVSGGIGLYLKRCSSSRSKKNAKFRSSLLNLSRGHLAITRINCLYKCDMIETKMRQLNNRKGTLTAIAFTALTNCNTILFYTSEYLYMSARFVKLAKYNLRS